MTREQGRELASTLFAGAPRASGVHAGLMQHTIDHLFGEVWQEPGLELQQRSLITCAVLVATGREAEQHLHFHGALNLGIERSTLEALITHVAHYAGWPVAVSAARVLSEVCARREAAAGDTGTTN